MNSSCRNQFSFALIWNVVVTCDGVYLHVTLQLKQHTCIIQRRVDVKALSTPMQVFW